jgi:anthranilate/para-aminobenzoate synthase component II
LSASSVVIIASGGANIASLQFALQRLGCTSAVSANARRIRKASHVILPGVGAAADAMSRLRQMNLDTLIPSLKQPVLGICLGMQLLFEASEEGEAQCLGIISGRAARAAFDQADATYRNTVLSAFQNVADSLRALQLDAATLRAQRTALKASSDTLDLAGGQFKLGAITYITLLNAQRSYQQARLAVVQAQAARFADTAALFQALGGGWWNRVDVAPNPYSPEANGLAEHVVGSLSVAPAVTEPH